MKHLMIDLETLDVTASAVILSAAAVPFSDTEVLLGSFYEKMSLSPQSAAGRSVSESTLRWWLEQSLEARAELNRDVQPYTHSLNRLHAFISMGGFDCLWANGPTFDLDVLEHAFAQHGLARPWQYNAPRDFRTIRDLVGKDLIPPSTEQHNALADATWQAEYVVAALKKLGVSRG